MPNNYDVGLHRLQSQGSIIKRFALLRTAAAARHIYNVSAENLASLLKGNPCTRTWLVEQGYNALAPERRHFANLAVHYVFHDSGILKNCLNFLARVIIKI
jgi:hypothetical protein